MRGEILVGLVLCIASVSSLNNGLARTPPMGWLSWAKFLCQIDCVRHPLTCISEQLYMDMADAMVDGGYVAAGYNRVNIDDCWMGMRRDSKGRLYANQTRFPHGIPWLANYVTFYISNTFAFYENDRQTPPQSRP